MADKITSSGKRSPRFKLQTLEQVCVVVPDLQKAMESMWNEFGIGPWNVYNYRSSDIRDVTYRGKPSRLGMAVARASMGTNEIELIQPTEGESTYTEFLKEHKNAGVHHLGWYTVKNLADTIRSMEEAGFPCVTSGRTYKAQFAYFDTAKALGIMLEAVCRDDSIPTRPPDRIWPQ